MAKREKGRVGIDTSGDGTIDLVFTAPNFARRGIASTLYHEAEKQLIGMGVKELKTESSVVARPFFERHGFEVVRSRALFLKCVRFRMVNASSVDHAP